MKVDIFWVVLWMLFVYHFSALSTVSNGQLKVVTRWFSSEWKILCGLKTFATFQTGGELNLDLNGHERCLLVSRYGNERDRT